MGEPSIDSLHDVYEKQLSAARYKAERDAAMQELQAMRERNIELWMESGMANELVTCAEQKAERLGKLVWRLQNRLARSHRRERALRKGMRMWREKAIDNGKIATDAMFALDKWADPKMYTHRATVLAADGKPLREGEKPYRVDNGKQVEIRRIDPSNGESCVFVGVDGRSYGYWLRPGQLTHERPDTWERLDDDAGKNPFDYCKDVGHRLDTCENSEAYKARDLVRRAKALAGVSE